MAFVLDASIRLSQDIQGLAGIKSQLAGLTSSIPVNIDVKGGAQAATAKINQSLNTVAGTANKATQAINQMGASNGLQNVANQAKSAANATNNYAEAIFVAGRRYSAFIVATTGAFAVVQQFREGVKAVIDFEQSITRLSQISDAPREKIAALRQEILSLSQATGTSADTLGNVAALLAQAGFNPQETQIALKPLSQIELLPTFKSAQEAAEGLIAVLKQFNLEVTDSATVIDKLVAVGDKFAVSSQDIIEGVKRGGAAFAALGSNFDEFTALFTTIRQTTQESAEAVGTSLRNIATRLALPESIAALKSLGIEVEDQKGRFLGIIPVIKQLSAVYAELEERGDTLSQIEIAKQLGDTRQIGRFLAAVRNPEVLDEALDVSRNAAGRTAIQAEKALQTVGQQLKVLQAQANAFFQSIAPTVILPLLNMMIDLGKAAVTVANALAPLIPIVTTLLGAFAATKGLQLTVSLLHKLAATTTATSMANFVGPQRPVGAGGGEGFSPGGLFAVPALSGLATKDVSLRGGRGGVSGALQSPIAQFGLVAGAALFGDKLKELGASAQGTSKTLASFGGSLVKTTALVVGLGSIIQGLTPAQFLKTGGVGGMVSAGGLGGFARPMAGAALAVGALGFAAKESIEEAIGQKLSEAARAISEINVDFKPSDIQKVTDATSTLLNNALGSVEEFAGRFSGGNAARLKTDAGIGDIANATPKDMQAFVGGVGDRLSRLFTGDFGGALRLDNVTIEEARSKLRELLSSNIKALELLVQSVSQEAAASGGAMSPRQALVQNLIDVQGLGPRLAELIADDIQRVLGRSSFENNARIGQETADLEARKRETERITGEFNKLVVPTSLVAELNALGEAVKNTTMKIGAANAAIEGQLSTFGQIRAPGFQQFSPESVRRGLLENPAAFGDIGKQFPDVQNALQSLSMIDKIIPKFLTFLSANEEIANAAERQGIPTNRPSVRAQGDYFIEQFFKSQGFDRMPQEVQQKLTEVLRKIIKDFADQAQGTGSVIIPQEQVSALEKHFAPALESVVNTLIELLTVKLNKFIQTENQSLQAGGMLTSARLGRGETERGKEEARRAALERAGLAPTRPPIVSPLDVSTGGAQVRGGFTAQGKFIPAEPGLEGDVAEALKTAAEKIEGLVRAQNEADKALLAFQAGDTQGRTITDVFEQAKNAQLAMMTFNAGMQALGDVISDTPSVIQKREQGTANAINDYFDSQERLLKTRGSLPSGMTEQDLREQRRAALEQNKNDAQAAIERNKELKEAFNGLNIKFLETFEKIIRENAEQNLPENIFKDAVTEFQKSVGDLAIAIRPLTAAEVLKTPSANFADVTKRLPGFRQDVPPEMRQDVARSMFGGLNEGELRVALKDALREGFGTSFGGSLVPTGQHVGRLIAPPNTSIDKLSQSGAESLSRLVAERIVAGQVSRGEISEGDTGAIAKATSDIAKSISEFIHARGADNAATPARFGSVNDVTLPADIMAKVATKNAELTAAQEVKPQPFTTEQAASLLGQSQAQTEFGQSVSNFGGFVGQLQSAFQPFVDTIRSLTPVLPTTAGVTTPPVPATQPQASAIDSSGLKESVDTLAQSMQTLFESIGQREPGREGNRPDRQTGEQARVSIPGLEQVAQATERSAAATEGAIASQASLASAIEKGVGVKIDAIQNVNVQVDGLGDAVTSEVKPQLEAAARVAATDVVRRALADIASRVDSESAGAFLNAAAALG